MQPTLVMLEQVAAPASGSAAGSPLGNPSVSILLGLVAGYLGAYLKVKGANLATKEDFRDALERVKQNTQAVEEIRAEVSRGQAVDAELREAVKSFTIAAGSFLHSICWLAWEATAHGRVNQDLRKQYDDEAHRTSPQVMGNLAVIAALNRPTHDRLAGVADKIFELDVSLANAGIRAETDLDSGLEEMRECNRTAMALDREFRATIANLFVNSRVV